MYNCHTERCMNTCRRQNTSKDSGKTEYRIQLVSIINETVKTKIYSQPFSLMSEEVIIVIRTVRVIRCAHMNKGISGTLINAMLG